MSFFCTALVFGLPIFIIYKLVTGSSYATLTTKGLAARGILLSVNSTATRVPGKSNGVILERRQVRLDVEVPGQAPYVVDTQVLVPLNLRRDVMPGATVELRVDRKNKNTIAIVGPGSGFAVNGLVTAPPTTGNT